MHLRQVYDNEVCRGTKDFRRMGRPRYGGRGGATHEPMTYPRQSVIYPGLRHWSVWTIWAGCTLLVMQCEQSVSNKTLNHLRSLRRSKINSRAMCELFKYISTLSLLLCFLSFSLPFSLSCVCMSMCLCARVHFFVYTMHSCQLRKAWKGISEKNNRGIK